MFLAGGPAQAVEIYPPRGAEAGTSAQLTAVSCLASGCLAVGEYTDGRGHQQGMAVIENHAIFKAPVEVSPPVGSAGLSTKLTGVSCVASPKCAVSGYYLAQSDDLPTPMIAMLSGNTWGPSVQIGVHLPGGEKTSAAKQCAVHHQRRLRRSRQLPGLLRTATVCRRRPRWALGPRIRGSSVPGGQRQGHGQPRLDRVLGPRQLRRCRRDHHARRQCRADRRRHVRPTQTSRLVMVSHGRAAHGSRAMKPQSAWLHIGACPASSMRAPGRESRTVSAPPGVYTTMRRSGLQVVL